MSLLYSRDTKYISSQAFINLSKNKIENKLRCVQKKAKIHFYFNIKLWGKKIKKNGIYLPFLFSRNLCSDFLLAIGRSAQQTSKCMRYQH
jgi:hypothetical protein